MSAKSELDIDVRVHRAEVVFAPDTWVPTAIHDVEFRGVSQVAATEVMRLADPRNWHESAPDFFDRSEAGVWSGGSWQPREPDEQQSSFQLLEGAKWCFGPELRGGSINVLDISGVERRAGSSILYEYRLHHCIQTRFLSTWEPGGIDVDEGMFRASWDAGVLRMVASKSVRYTAQRHVPAEVTTLLNLLAPSASSLLLRHLVQDGTLGFLQEATGRGAGHAAREGFDRGAAASFAPATGGFPGFDWGSQLFMAYGRALLAQTNAMNDAWANVRGGADPRRELAYLVANSWAAPARFWRTLQGTSRRGSRS